MPYIFMYGCQRRPTHSNDLSNEQQQIPVTTIAWWNLISQQDTKINQDQEESKNELKIILRIW